MTASRTSRRRLWILLLTAALTCRAGRIGRSSAEDAPVDAAAADATEPLIIDNPALLRIKRDTSLILPEVLSSKIEDIDHVCHLTDAEKEKLRLAGRGDIKRFLDRVHDLEASLKSPTTLAARELGSLRRLMTSGIFEEGSLFSKTRRRILTPEQLMKLEAETIDTSWMKDFQEAQALASRLDRPVLMHFSAKWCGPGQKLERVMESPAVLRVLRRKFVLVALDVDQNPDLVKKFSVQRIPCEIVVTTKGETLCRSEGLKEELEFLHALRLAK